MYNFLWVVFWIGYGLISLLMFFLGGAFLGYVGAIYPELPLTPEILWAVLLWAVLLAGFGMVILLAGVWFFLVWIEWELGAKISNFFWKLSGKEPVCLAKVYKEIIRGSKNE